MTALTQSLPAAAPSSQVRVNSIGFVPALAKRATVLGAASALSFSVRRVGDDVSVFDGTLGGAFVNSDSGETVRLANFDAVASPGTYYLDVSGLGRSVSFTVAADAFHASLRLNLMGFYNQRCGMSTSMSHNGVTWGHAACHSGDASLFYYDGSSNTKNATGGWHDAGDYNKYVINAAATLGPLLHAWERHKPQLEGLTLASGTDLGLPDYLEEVKWELQWLAKMQFPDGRVSDKITVWGGFEPFVFPPAHLATRYFTTWGTAEIASFTAVMALAARVYAPYDAAYGAQLQAMADLSYAYLQANPANVTANISGTPQGNYTQSDGHSRLWAAVEMWESSGDPAALADAEARINALSDKCDGYWDWNKLFPLGTVTYALSQRPGRDSSLLSAVQSAIFADAVGLLSARNSHGYGRAGTAYYWGANGVVARFAYVLDAAALLGGGDTYRSVIQEQLGWLYGRNQYNRSQVTGEGHQPPLFPHDRESATDYIDPPKPGHLVGGGTSASNWLDDVNRADLNEIAINWDGAMAYALASLCTYFGPVPTATPTPSVTPSPSVTRTPSISPTPSESPTHSVSPTISPSFSPSPIATISATFSASPTVSPTPTASPSATASPTQSPEPPSVTPTPVQDQGGALKVLEHRFMPQPLRGASARLFFKLEHGAQSVRWRVYSASAALLKEQRLSGPFPSGWSSAWVAIPELPNGVSFSLLQAERGAESSPGQRMPVYILR